MSFALRSTALVSAVAGVLAAAVPSAPAKMAEAALTFEHPPEGWPPLNTSLHSAVAIVIVSGTLTDRSFRVGPNRRDYSPYVEVRQSQALTREAAHERLAAVVTKAGFPPSEAYVAVDFDQSLPFSAVMEELTTLRAAGYDRAGPMARLTIDPPATPSHPRLLDRAPG